MTIEQREQTWSAPAAGARVGVGDSSDTSDRAGLLRSPILQTTLVVTLAVLVALAAAVALTLANFNRALSDTVESRFEFLAFSIRDDIETGLNLGLGLSELTNVQDIIDDRLARDASVIRIAVETTEGETLFETSHADAAGRAATADSVEAGLENTFGQTVGRVRVVYATGSYQATVRRVGEALARNSALLTLFVGGVAALGCGLLLRAIPRSLARIRAWFRNGRVEGTPHNDIERTAAEAVATSHTVLAELEDISRDLPKLATGEQR